MAFLKYLRSVNDTALDFVVPCVQCGKEYVPAREDPYGLCPSVIMLNNFCSRACMDANMEEGSNKNGNQKI